MIPSGANSLAPQNASTNSACRPAMTISLASFNGSLAILALRGESSAAHSSAAFCPTSSLSNIKTTDSKPSSHSIACLISFFAPAAPVLIETTGHLWSNAWLIASASNSPSTIVTLFPLSRHSHCPYRSASFMLPLTENSLPAVRIFCATVLPSLVL